MRLLNSIQLNQLIDIRDKKSSAEKWHSKQQTMGAKAQI